MFVPLKLRLTHAAYEARNWKQAFEPLCLSNIGNVRHTDVKTEPEVTLQALSHHSLADFCIELAGCLFAQFC